MRVVRLEAGVNGVRTLTLDDDSKRNAIGPLMQEQLVEAVEMLDADQEARCLIVAGAGKAFCAGGDLASVFDPEDPPSRMRARALETYESFLGIRRLPFPTIAAVDGAAIGAGLNLALVCDVTISGPRARFGVTFSKLGIHPGGGCTYFLTRALGTGRALRLMMLGAIIDGREAFEIGLADDFSEDPLAAAGELAEAVAALEPNLVRDMKTAVSIAAVDGFAATVGFESWSQTGSVLNPGVLEAIHATGHTTSTRSGSA